MTEMNQTLAPGSSASPTHTFVVAVPDADTYRAALATLGLLVAAQDAPNLVRIRGVSETSGETMTGPSASHGHCLCITEDEVRGLSLEALMKLSLSGVLRPLTPQELACVAFDILTCLHHLHHDSCLLHGGVNLHTIVLDCETHRVRLRTSPYAQQALLGYTTGTAFLFSLMLQSLSESESFVAADTLYWCAPEVFAAGSLEPTRRTVVVNTFASDTFSFGVTLLYTALCWNAGATTPRASGSDEDEGEKNSNCSSSSADGDRSGRASLHERVVACVHALQSVNGAFDADGAELPALAARYGDAFVDFLSRCVSFAASGRFATEALLASPFLHENDASDLLVREGTLAALVNCVELSTQDVVSGTYSHHPVANEPQHWMFPVGCLCTVGGRNEPSSPLPLGSPVAAGEGQGRSAVTAGASSALPSVQFCIPEDPFAVGSAPSSCSDTRDETDEPPLPASVLLCGGGNAHLTSSSSAAALDEAGTEQQRELGEDCASAFLAALSRTQTILNDVYRRERRQATTATATVVETQQRALHFSQSQRPLSSPQTPATSHGATPSQVANMANHLNANASSNARWTPKMSMTSAMTPIVAGTAVSAAAAQSPAKLPTAPPPPRQPAATSATSAEQELIAVHNLLTRMREEIKELQRLAPEFAGDLCQEFANGAARDVETVASCVDTVRHLLPPIVLDENAEAAAAVAADEAAQAYEQRRRAARVDFSKPFRTAADWSQALSMPSGTMPMPDMGTGAGTSLLGVGGGAAALLYNKWLKAQQRKAANVM